MIFTPIADAKIITAMVVCYPDGSVQSGCVSLASTRDLVSALVWIADYGLKLSESPVRITLQRDPKEHGPNDLRGLILYSEATRATTLIALEVSPGLVRLGKKRKPIALNCREGSVNLHRAISAEIKKVVGKKAKK